MSATDKPVIIECRMNEWQRRDRNPHVPWSPEELADDALACWQAGASIVHFHVRADDGSPSHDVQRYAQAIRAIRARCDVLIHPTMAGVLTPAAHDRIRPLEVLCADPGTRPDFAPLDMGSTNLDAYDAASHRFTTEAKSYVNSVETLRFLAGRVQALGLKELMCAWTVPCLRTVDAFIDAGWIRDDPAALVCIVLTEGGILGGHPGSVEGLDSMLRFMPARKLEWSVCCREGSMLTLAEAAIARGGHVSIGLGDHVHPEIGTPTNAELVSRMAHAARAGGRRAATVADTRDMLGVGRQE